MNNLRLTNDRLTTINDLNIIIEKYSDINKIELDYEIPMNLKIYCKTYNKSQLDTFIYHYLPYCFTYTIIIKNIKKQYYIKK